MKKLLFQGKSLFQHELISGSSYIFLGSMVANICSFLFNLFLARNLSTSDYGVYASILSLTMLIGIPSQSIFTTVMKFATEYMSKKEYGKAHSLYVYASQFTLGVGLIGFFGFLFFSPVLSNFLKIDNIFFLFLGGILIAIGYISIVNSSFLQSLLKFRYLSFLSSISSVTKLVIGILLVALGWKVAGALLVLIIAAIIPYVLGFFPLRLVLHTKEKDKIPLRAILIYALPAAIAVIATSSFTYMDIVLVKHFFSPHDAGLYAGLSLVGKVIFYFTLPIPSVMFPLLVKNFHTGKKTNTVFYMSFLLVLIPAMSITIIYFLFPQIAIKLFLGGGSYLSVARLLGFEGLYLSLFSLLNVVINFFLSSHKTKIAIPLGVASIAQVAAISIFHKSLFEVLAVSIIIVLVLLVGLLLYYLHEKAKENSS